MVVGYNADISVSAAIGWIELVMLLMLLVMLILLIKEERGNEIALFCSITILPNPLGFHQWEKISVVKQPFCMGNRI